MFLKKFLSFNKIFKYNFHINCLALRKFSGSHGHSEDSHGHGHEEDSSSHKPIYDRVSYNKKLKKGEREEIPFTDKFNDKHSFWVPRVGEYKSIHRIEVMIPKDEVGHFDDSFMDKTEIEARIYNILRQFDFMELDKFDFEKSYNDLGLDSLEWVALMTSVENEFHTAFEDNLYDHFKSIAELVHHLALDHNAF